MLSGAILRLTTTGDADRDGIDDAWATTFGLQGLPPDARGPFGDPDGDGRINAQEFREGTHPLAGPVAYFGEGANGFFATRLDVLNEQDVDLALAVRFVRADGQATSTSATVPARRSLAIDTTTVPGLAGAEFATVIEATRPVPALRTMTWPAVGESYGSHAEHADRRACHPLVLRRGRHHAVRAVLPARQPVVARHGAGAHRLPAPGRARGVADVRRRAGLASDHLGQSGARPRSGRTRRRRRVGERRTGAGRACDVHPRRRRSCSRPAMRPPGNPRPRPDGPSPKARRATTSTRSSR